MKRRVFLKNGFTGVCGFCILPGTVAFGDTGDKYTCEALYYKRTPRGIKCSLCPHNCNVSDIRPGSCRTKFVKNGKLFSSAFGNPFYVKTITPETEFLYHFLPGEKVLAIGTAGCNLTCQYCKVSDVSQKSPDQVTSTSLFPKEVVEMCLSKKIKSIAYTYSEPVAFFEYMLATAKLARENGIKNILVSNGYIHEEPLRELCKYLDAAVISIKAFSDATYQKIAGGSIFPVFSSLKVLKEMKVWTELTHVVVPGWTDNFQLLEKMCSWMKENGFENNPFHFLKFEPQFRMSQLEPAPEELMDRAVEVAVKSGLPFVYGKHQLNTVCPNCKHVIAERKNNKVFLNGIKYGECTKCKTKIAGIWS